jgi:SAM-dependent methyltransferase
MRSHDPGTYGTKVGAEYDELYPGDPVETESAVATLCRLAEEAGGRSILEFGSGTGRLAIPLAGRGPEVVGIEASQTMADQMAAKPGGELVQVVVGDFLSLELDRSFSVVVLPFNGIFGPANRDDQLACFSNAARHLEPGGCFVVEAFVLRPEQLRGDWWVAPRYVFDDHVELQLCRYDTASHTLERNLVHLRSDGIRFLRLGDRYAWPGELDLMARAAGLRLRHRYGGWNGEEFGPSSFSHVSIYEPASG